MTFNKTILQVIPSMDSGGAERTTLEMTRAIIAAGGRAIVATARGRLTGAVEAAGGRVHILSVDTKNPAGVLANATRLAALIRAENVDLIHARSRAPAWSALLAARRTGIPLVTTWHGAYRSGTPWKRLYNSAMARGDLVIANSAFTAEAVRAAGVRRVPLRIIHRGADIEEFNPERVSPARVESLRSAWATGTPRPFTMLLPARLTEWKGHRLAMEALRQIAAAGPSGASGDLRLIFVGGAQGRRSFAADLERGVKDLGLERMVRFAGHCDDMPAAYLAADVVLSPSTRPEAFGRVAAEAAAMARVAIAADHGGARETIVDRETGFLVEPGSASALAEVLRHTISLGAEGRAAMGARARTRIAQSFSTAAMTAATLDAYQSLFDARASAS